MQTASFSHDLQHMQHRVSRPKIPYVYIAATYNTCTYIHACVHPFTTYRYLVGDMMRAIRPKKKTMFCFQAVLTAAPKLIHLFFAQECKIFFPS